MPRMTLDQLEEGTLILSEDSNAPPPPEIKDDPEAADDWEVLRESIQWIRDRGGGIELPT